MNSPMLYAITAEEKVARIETAMRYLRLARYCLESAGATRTLARVRAALKSADGARRHASLSDYRTARQQEKQEHGET